MKQRQRFHITLINGERVWITGNTVDEVFDSAFRKYGYLYRDVFETPETNCPTITEYLGIWLNKYRRPKIGGRRYTFLKNIIDAEIVPVLGAMKLDQIGICEAMKFVDSMEERPNVLYHTFWILKNMYSYAIEDGYVGSNPFISKKISVSMKYKNRRSLTKPELEDIFSKLKEYPVKQQMEILIPLYSGMRLGEVFALLWEDIDFDNKLIHVSKNLSCDHNNRPLIKDPKTKAGNRLIPILPELEPILLQNRQQSGNVILSARHKPYNLPGATAEASRLMKSLGVADDITYHCLRHTFATVMSHNTDAKTLQYILGHAKYETTMNIYVHVEEEKVAKVANLCDQLY